MAINPSSASSLVYSADSLRLSLSVPSFVPAALDASLLPSAAIGGLSTGTTLPRLVSPQLSIAPVASTTMSPDQQLLLSIAPSLNEPLSISNPVLTSSAWDPADRETVLRSYSPPHFIESSGMKIQPFLNDAKLFLRLCGRPRERWKLFVLQWLGVDEADKVRRSHVAEKIANYKYDEFRSGLVTLFGRFEFEHHYRSLLRVLRQSGSESVASFAARTSDLCSRTYPTFSTDDQLSLAVEHFVSGLADTSSREYLRRERARRSIAWQEAVQITQASEVPSLVKTVAPMIVSDCAVSHVPSSAYSHTTCDFRNHGAQATLEVREHSHVGNTAYGTNVAAPGWHTNPVYQRANEPRPANTGNQQHSQRGKKQCTNSWNRIESDAPRSSAPTRFPEAQSLIFQPSSSLPQQSFAQHFEVRPAISSLTRQSSCFNCKKMDHLLAQCPLKVGVGRKCYCCGGVEHLARDCLSRSDITSTPNSSISSTSSSARYSSSSAVTSAGKGAPQLFSVAVLDGVVIRRALIDTGSTLSMVPDSTCAVSLAPLKFNRSVQLYLRSLASAAHVSTYKATSTYLSNLLGLKSLTRSSSLRGSISVACRHGRAPCSRSVCVT